MAWTGTAGREHSRDGLRYPSDMTDAEWAVTEPFIPPAKRGGRPRTTDMREVVNALLYIASAGCAWRLLPKCFPPASPGRFSMCARALLWSIDCVNVISSIKY